MKKGKCDQLKKKSTLKSHYLNPKLTNIIFIYLLMITATELCINPQNLWQNKKEVSVLMKKLIHIPKYEFIIVLSFNLSGTLVTPEIIRAKRGNNNT